MTTCQILRVALAASLLLGNAGELRGQAVAVARPDTIRSVRPDSIRSLVLQRRAEVDRAAIRFFDQNVPLSDRLEAVKNIHSFLTRSQIAAALRVAFDRSAPSQYRVAALRLGKRGLLNDPALQKQLLVMLTDQSTPSDVRHEAIGVLEDLLVARQVAGVDSVLRLLSSDSDSDIRSIAIARLALRGDGPTRKQLIDGLRQPARAVVPEEVALALLAAHVDADVIAVAQEILKSRPNGQVRRLALRISSASKAGSEEALRVLLDPAAPSDLRIAAIRSLVVQDPVATSLRVLPVLRNESDNDSVRVAIIDALHFHAPEDGTEAATRLESELRRLVRDTKSSDVRAAAGRYLDDLKGA